MAFYGHQQSAKIQVIQDYYRNTNSLKFKTAKKDPPFSAKYSSSEKKPTYTVIQISTGGNVTLMLYYIMYTSFIKTSNKKLKTKKKLVLMTWINKI